MDKYISWNFESFTKDLWRRSCKTEKDEGESDETDNLTSFIRKALWTIVAATPPLLLTSQSSTTQSFLSFTRFFSFFFQSHIHVSQSTHVLVLVCPDISLKSNCTKKMVLAIWETDRLRNEGSSSRVHILLSRITWVMYCNPSLPTGSSSLGWIQSFVRLDTPVILIKSHKYKTIFRRIHQELLNF